MWRRSILAVSWLLVATSTWAADGKHLGVATCASTTCHGQARAATTGNIQQTEYLIWSRFDPHAGAYALLFEERSRLMAQRLGLKSAHEATECLACHTDNVPASARGPKFQASDGIGCEACHGGAGNWLASHYDPKQAPKALHAANVANGLVALDDPAVRARACLGCHVGDAGNRFASHRIMAAGHPRLPFELDTWTELWRTAGGRQHYLRDADYVARKQVPASIAVWSQGLVHQSLQQVGLVTARYGAGGALPDFALFNCYSCHRDMRLGEWRDKAPAGAGEPGQLRFDASAMTLLEAALATRPAEASALRKAVLGWQQASGAGAAVATRAGDTLASALRRALTALAREPLKPADAPSALAALSRGAAAGTYPDYASAEQAAMGTVVLGSGARCGRATADLLGSLRSDAAFSQSATAERLKRAAGSCAP